LLYHAASSRAGNAKREQKYLKSIVAVFAGAVASIMLSVGTDALMHATGIFPAGTEPMNDARFALATIYRTIYGVVGAYITARLAPNRPMMHALALGALVLLQAPQGLSRCGASYRPWGRNDIHSCSSRWHCRPHWSAENFA
jgi:hypothetical protein